VLHEHKLASQSPAWMAQPRPAFLGQRREEPGITGMETAKAGPRVAVPSRDREEGSWEPEATDLMERASPPGDKSPGSPSSAP
jgi:hypothetical protein